MKGEDGKEEKDNDGRTAQFTKDGRVISYEVEEGKKKERDHGTYQLQNEGEFIVTRMTDNEREDKLRILELSSNTFKVETPNKEIVTLKRVD